MESIQGNHKASKLSTKDDLISSMPDILITHIMNLLPIQDAARTSILARNWRFKWTLLTQLVFDHDFVGYSTSQLQKNIVRDISKLFIHLKGPITKFVFYVPDEKVLNDNDLCHWVMFLSRKGITEFSFLHYDYNEILIKLPTHLLSCHELTHLKLCGCQFPSPSTFGSFPNLLSLDLERVTFSSGFCDIITLCPLLEILKIYDNDPRLKVKLVEVAKLENLKMLSMPLLELDSMAFTNSLIVPGEGYFPKLQELFLSFWYLQFEREAPKKLVCDSFSLVKTLTLELVEFDSGFLLPFAFEIIWGCPNLQTLIIEGSEDSELESHTLCPSELEYITMGQLQLVNVVIKNFRGFENELILIKYLLACAPLLDRFTIHSGSPFSKDKKEKSTIAEELLRLPRASTIAQVDLRWL